jgi:N-acetylornithine carbamoyltransferase
MGHDLTIAHPQGYELDDELMETIRECAAQSGGNVTVSNDVEAAVENVEVVYAKSWGSKNFYGANKKDIAERAKYREKWIVDEAKMARTNEAIFMHCLPVRRNVIVTDSVIDSPSSVVIDEAENRLHVQKAILAQLLGRK